MSLSDEQCAKLYKMVIEDNTNLSWIKERLEKGDISFEQFDVRLTKLEREHAHLTGKVGAFILALTFFVSVIVNSFLWIFSRLGGKS